MLISVSYIKRQVKNNKKEDREGILNFPEKKINKLKIFIRIYGAVFQASICLFVCVEIAEKSRLVAS